MIEILTAWILSKQDSSECNNRRGKKRDERRYTMHMNNPWQGKLNRYKIIPRPCSNEHSGMNKTAFTKGRHSTPPFQSLQSTPHPITLFPTLEGPNKLHGPHPPCCIAQRSSKGTALYSTVPISSTHLHHPPTPLSPTYEAQKQITLTTSTMLRHTKIKQRDSTLLHYPDLLNPPPPSPNPTFPNIWRPKTNYTDRIHHAAPCKDQAVLNVLQELGVGLQIQHPNLL